MSTQARPEIPLRVITQADVRASIRRALRGLEKAAEEIVWQIEVEAWVTLGYSSWTAMRETEYGGAAVMLPSGSRPRIAARLKEIQIGTTARGGPKHLIDQEIADTIGVSRRQVQDDLRGNNEMRRSAHSVYDDDIVDAAPPIKQKADPVTAESAPTQITCPTCGGTGKVTQ